ncbi:hypothetical protein [Fundidesulfovibrio soli]|uniref:hypothetical protein n=1 Tax=Fundidesulfovibrio soli TaxID=2922716 RepID=UPI001FB01F14|nr:hypothetical protein [Fundidesulfovibrio soli]
MRLILTLVCALLLTASSALAQERDGAYWNQQNDIWKYAYLTGVLDGVVTGGDFSQPVLSRGSVALYKPDQPCVEKTRTTYEYNTSRYFFGLSLKEFVEGMDAFYKDPANKHIPVNKALRVWAMQRKHVPEAAEILEELRKEWAAGS